MHEWRTLEAVGPQALDADAVWRAHVIEEQAPGKREGEPVGNVGMPPNANTRQLVIEVLAADARAQLRREVIDVASETIENDPCAVRRVEKFQAEGQTLTITLVRDTACGAGSSVSTTYRLEIGREQTRLISWGLNSASRDAVWSAEIEYPDGRLTVRDESPDSDPDQLPKILKISKIAPALTAQSFSQCLPPLRGPDVMNCSQP
ncbi:hypothetical protein [Arenimonas sp.]|uniref:hypothetical protein n=1 Tax=Arenimonas sp. TaxID=1872635 RepID=UPI0039E4D465